MAAGRVKSKPVQTGKGGFADVVQWTMATAASNHLTVLRSFAHGTDAGFPLQSKPGRISENDLHSSPGCSHLQTPLFTRF